MGSPVMGVLGCPTRSPLATAVVFEKMVNLCVGLNSDPVPLGDIETESTLGNKLPGWPCYF